MTTATHLLDTSAVIALERGTPLDAIEDSVDWATSTMTVAELNVGVLRSPTATIHQRRLKMFQKVCSRPVIDMDLSVALTWAEIRVWAGSLGIRPSVPDGIVAATAVTCGLVLVTLDQGFKALEGFEGLELLVLPSPQP